MFRFVIGHPRLIGGVACVLTCAAVWGVTRLRIEDDPYAAVRVGSAEFSRLEELSLAYGFDDESVVVVLEADDFFTLERIAALRKLVGRFKTHPEVSGTYSLLDARRPGPGRLQLPLFPETSDDLADMERARRYAEASTLVRGQLLSDDGRTALMLVSLRPETRNDVRVLEPLLQTLKTAAQQELPKSGITARFTGVPAIRVELVRATERNVVVTTVLGCAAALVISLLILRDWRAVLTASLPPALASLWILGFLGLAGISVNILSAVVSTLVLVVGLSDSIHLSQDIWRRRFQPRDNEQAAVDALRHSGIACGITALTTAFGFASLALTDSPIVREYGLILACGALVAFVATVLFVPLLAGLFPHYRVADQEGAVSRTIEAATRRVVGFSLARRKVICVFCAIAFLLTGRAVFLLQADTSLTENLPGESEGRAALHCADTAFGGVFHTLVVVHWPASERLESPATEAALRDAQRLVQSSAVFNHPLSLINVVESMPNLGANWQSAVRVLTGSPRESLRRFFDAERREALVFAHTPEIGSAAIGDAVDETRERLRQLEQVHPGYRFELSGTPVVATTIVNQLLIDLGAGLGLEALMILLVISCLFRSLRLGLISLVPNLFPLACVAAVMALVDMPLHFGSVMVFNICLGLAVDDTVHLVSRIGDARSEPTAEDMIRRGVAGVGTAVVAATLILCAGFAALTVSEVYASRVFGVLSCVTLAASFVAELILLPAVLAVGGRRALERRAAEGVRG